MIEQVARIQRNTRPDRRGIEVLELVLALPVLVLALIAGIRFATLANDCVDYSGKPYECCSIVVIPDCCRPST